MSNKLDEFDTFWKLYPRKIGKEKARGAWAKALRLTNAATIIAGLGRLLSSLVANEPQFIPHPATWLNGGRWTDEADTEATPRGAAYVPFSPERQAQDLADRERIATGDVMA